MPDERVPLNFQTPAYSDQLGQPDPTSLAEFARLIGLYDVPEFVQHYPPDETPDNFYTEYDIRTVYANHQGVELGKAAGLPGTPHSVMRVHAPVTKKFVIWRAERYGDKPVLPSADTGNANEVLYKSIIVPYAPRLQPGGALFHHVVEGAYVWLLYNSVDESDVRHVAATPLHDVLVADLNRQGFTFSTEWLKTSPPAAFGQLNISSPS